METIFWLIVVAVMLVIEIFTLGLTTIWFSLGAVVAAIASVLGAPIWLQIVLFAVVSVIVMVLVRPFAMKVVNRDRVQTNIEEVIGKTAVVIKRIDNRAGEGTVRFRGVEWTARSTDEEVIEIDEDVVIESVSGVKLIVRRAEKENREVEK